MIDIELMKPWEHVQENAYTWTLENTVSDNVIELTIEKDPEHDDLRRILHRKLPTNDPTHTHIADIIVSNTAELEEIMRFLAFRIARHEHDGNELTPGGPYNHITPSNPSRKLGDVYEFLIEEYSDQYAMQRNPLSNPDNTEQLL